MPLVSSEAHGVVDYFAAPTLIVLPRLAGWPESVRKALTGLASFSLGYSMLTNYELGLWKALPSRGHLALDSAVAAGTAAVPLWSAEENPKTSRALVAIALAEAAIIALSSINRR